MSSRGFNHNNCFICFKSPYKNPGISLHRFPTCPKLRLIWLKACKLTESDYLSSRRLCSSHFDKKCFNTNYVRKSLKRGSVPTIFTKEELECSMLEKEQMKGDGSRISTERSTLKRESENKSRISIECSKVKKESEDKSKKSVVILEVSSNEEESSEKESLNDKESSNEEEILFCPTSMVRYDNPFNPYSTQWVCRNCLSVMLSEDAVHKHLKVLCEHRNIADLGLNNKYDDDIENNGDDDSNKEDDDKSNKEDCDEGNKKNDGSGTGNKKEGDDDDDDDDVDMDDDSDDDYHEDDEDEDEDDYEDEDDEINDPLKKVKKWTERKFAGSY